MKFLECVFHAGREVSLGKTASIACNASNWSEKSISRMWRSPRGSGEGGERSRVHFILQWVNYCNKYVQFVESQVSAKENMRRRSKTMEIVAFSFLDF